MLEKRKRKKNGDDDAIRTDARDSYICRGALFYTLFYARALRFMHYNVCLTA